MRRGLADNLDTGLACRLRRQRPNADRRNVSAEPAERARRRRRGEHDEVAVGSDGRRQLTRPVERDEVGAELLDEQPARTFRAREEDAPRRARKLRQQALLGRDAGDEGARRRRRPRSRGRLRPPARACPVIRRRSSRAPLTLVTMIQSYPETSTGSSPSGSTSSSGQWTTSCRSATRPRISSSSCPFGLVTTTLTRRRRAALAQPRRDRCPSAARSRRHPRRRRGLSATPRRGRRRPARGNRRR